MKGHAMSQSIIDTSDGTIHVPTGNPHTLNVTLDQEKYDMLAALARESDLSKAVIIRQLIGWRYAMQIQYVPVCSTGGRCHCPQLHPPPQTSPHQTLVPQDKPT